MEFFERQPLMLFIATGMVGLIIGSFLNVVASRVPIMLGRIWRKEYADIKIKNFYFRKVPKMTHSICGDRAHVVRTAIQ